MNISMDERWETFVEKAVREGRYPSATDVVREGLRLVEEKEAKIALLRQTLDRSIERGGGVDDTELDILLDVKARKLAQQGF